jgi:hypothetical protein
LCIDLRSSRVAGRAMRTSLYRGVMAELIHVALCRMSMGGVVARSRHLVALMSILCRVVISVQMLNCFRRSESLSLQLRREF